MLALWPAEANTVDDLNNLLASTDFCHLAYNMLNKKIASIPHLKVKMALRLQFSIGGPNRLAELIQFGFHRRITTNSYLFKIGITYVSMHGKTPGRSTIDSN